MSHLGFFAANAEPPGPEWEVVNLQAAHSTGGSTFLTIQVGNADAEAGDYIIMGGTLEENVAQTFSGWTELLDAAASQGEARRNWVGYRVVTSPPPATISVAFPTTGGGSLAAAIVRGITGVAYDKVVQSSLTTGGNVSVADAGGPLSLVISAADAADAAVPNLTFSGSGIVQQTKSVAAGRGASVCVTEGDVTVASGATTRRCDVSNIVVELQLD